jgi:hypothetical protein
VPKVIQITPLPARRNSNPGPGVPSTFTSGSQQIQTIKVGVNYLFYLTPTPVVAKY